MVTQFITNDKGQKTAAIVPINEYQDLLLQHHLNLELSDGYKKMIDEMLEEEDKEGIKYIQYKTIKNLFPGRAL